jgi:hypothetical protein
MGRSANEYVVGERVWVHAMGNYYLGEVTRVGNYTLTIKYASGSGKEHHKIGRPEQVLYFYDNGYEVTIVKDVTAENMSEPPAGSRQMTKRGRL